MSTPPLIAKISKGAGFRGLINYLIAGRRGRPRELHGEQIGGNVHGAGPREIAREFGAVRELRPDVKRPVLHASLSLPVGQHLSSQQWRVAAETWMREMGIDPAKHPHAIFIHRAAQPATPLQPGAKDGTTARDSADVGSLDRVGLDDGPPPSRRGRLRALSDLDVVPGRQPGQLLLSGDVSDRLAVGHGDREQRDAVRQPAPPTPHEHIHIVISRIGFDGSLSREQRGDYKRSHAAAAAAARAVGLKPTDKPAPERRGPRLTKRDRGELDAGELPDRLRIVGVLDAAVAQAGDWEQLKAAAAAAGVEIAEVSNAGGVYGIKARLLNAPDGEPGSWLKGSQLGKAYSYRSLLLRLQSDGADVCAGLGRRPRRDILSSLTRQQAAGGTVDYHWSGSGKLAVRLSGNSIAWRTGSDQEARAAAAVAAAEGWGAVEIADRGSIEKNDAAIIAYLLAGVAVTNIQLSEHGYAKYIAERDGPSVGAGTKPHHNTGATSAQHARNTASAAPAADRQRRNDAGGTVGSSGHGRAAADPRPVAAGGGSDFAADEGAGKTGRPDQRARDLAEAAAKQKTVVAALEMSQVEAAALRRRIDTMIRDFAARASAGRREIGEALPRAVAQLIKSTPPADRSETVLHLAARLQSEPREIRSMDDAKRWLGMPASDDAKRDVIAKIREELARELAPAAKPRPGDPGLRL